MHQPVEQPSQPEDDDEKNFSLNLEILGGMLPAFPEWFKKLYHLLMIKGYANLGFYYKSLRKDELEDALTLFRKANQNDPVATKNIMLFTMINMLCCGDSNLTNTSVYNTHLKIAAMVLASAFDKNGTGIAHYEKFDLENDVNTYFSLKKPLDPEVQNAS